MTTSAADIMKQGMSGMLLALSIGFAATAYPQSYPNRAIRLVVGFPPGGAVDILGRIVSPPLSEKLKQPVVVENRPGAGTRLAAEIVSKAPADGYTLLMITSAHTAGPGLYKKLPYNTVESFSAVALVASTPLVLLTHTSLPVRSLKDFVALAKRRPGSLNYGSSGVGAPPHLATELFKKVAGINVVHVPYKGSAPAFTDLVGGQIEFMFAALPGSIPYITSGRLKALAITSAKRSPAMRDLPTIAESGFPGFEVTNWYGVLGPAGLDPKIIGQLSTEIAAVLKLPDVTEAIARVGAESEYRNPQQFESYLQSEVSRWTRVIREAGIVPE